MAEAYLWVNKITTCCLAMVLPSAGGFWVDNYFRTTPILGLLGLIIGAPLGIYMLIKITEEKPVANSIGPK